MIDLNTRADLRAAIRRLMRAANGAPVVGGAQHGSGNYALVEVERRDVALLLGLVQRHVLTPPEPLPFRLPPPGFHPAQR